MSFRKVSLSEIRNAENDNFIGIALSQYDNQRVESELNQDSNLINTSKRLILEFNRNSSFYLDDNQITEGTQDNLVILRNPSLKDKVWNVKLNLEEVAQEFYINEVAPNDFWEYSLEKNEDLTSKLNIYEIFRIQEHANNRNDLSETYLQRGVKNDFYCSIFIYNNSDQVLQDIQITKRLPTSLNQVSNTFPQKGTITTSKSKINWKISELLPNEEVKLDFIIDLQPKSCKTGQISGSYRIDTEGSSTYRVKNFTGSVKTAQFINIDELDEKPGHWNCSFEILNRSDFLLKVNNAKVSQMINNNQEQLFEEKNLILQPYEEKTVYNEVIQSKERPKISKNVKFNPDYVVRNEIVSSFIVAEKSFDMLEISAEKHFSKNSIKSFEETTFDVILSVRNHSTLPINHLLIQEISDSTFTHIDIEQMEIKLMGETKKLKELPFLSLGGTKGDENLNELNLKISQTNQKMRELSKQIDENKEILEKDSPENFEKLITSLDQERESLTSHKISIIQKIDFLKSEIESTSNENNTVEEKISLNSKELEEIKSQEDSIAEKGDFERKLTKEKKNLTSNQKKLVKLESKLAELKENLENEVEEVKKLKLESKVKETEEKISIFKNSEIVINEKIEEIAKSIVELSSRLKFNNQEEAKSEESKFLNLIEASRKKLEENHRKILDCEKEISENENSLTEAEMQLSNHTRKTHSTTESIELNKKIQEELKEKEKEIQNHIQILENLNNRIDELKNHNQKYQNGILSSEELRELFNHNQKVKDAKILLNQSDYGNKSQVLIEIINIEELIGEFAPDDEIQFVFKMKCQKAKNDIDYKFPSSIIFDTNPPKGANIYSIPPQNLPFLEITHDRKKISLGKVIDHYSEEGVYQVLLLIRNRGSTFINSLQIIDTIPDSAKISNAFYKYSEHQVSAVKKEIIWEIDQIAPHEEIEITYLVDLGEEDQDLNDFELILK
jgi:hypothetical protein